MKTIGLLINPVAGMGGEVGLKGTDGRQAEAALRGAVPRAGMRAGITLRALAGERNLEFLTPAGVMGEEALRQSGILRLRVVSHPGPETAASDTKEAARRFLEEGADLVLFCGGDGTARDIFDSVGREVPILGIPAGVKMYSGVFAVNPAIAADIVKGCRKGLIRDSEVVDVDEDAYRAGVLKTRIYGVARVPFIAELTQVSKQVFEDADEERAKEEIARFIDEIMIPGVLYILGAGTTMESVARKIGIEKTLLGVDAVMDRRLVARDLDEKRLWALLEGGQEAKILVSPIGAQGFILGRGNQQISPRIVRRAGIRNIIVVATPQKLRQTPLLYVDSGDPDLDAGFGDSVPVISGYRMAQRRKIFRLDTDGSPPDPTLGRSGGNPPPST